MTPLDTLARQTAQEIGLHSEWTHKLILTALHQATEASEQRVKELEAEVQACKDHHDAMMKAIE